MEQKIGKYEIREQLGAGSFGVVFRAFDAIEEQEVALKVAVGSDEMFEVLAREARTLRRLKHANVVRIYNADIIGYQFVIAMEYMAGGSLGEYLKRSGKPLDADSAGRIMLQMLAGLEYAHREHNIVHRDLKPGNVLFSGDMKTVKLADFGIAKALDTRGFAMTVVGTPPYMAPEHLDGRATLQSDVYSAGVILYEMVCGRRAFDVDTDTELRRRIQAGEFVRPRQANRRVAPELEAVILRAMARDHRKRYPSAEAMAADLGDLSRVKEGVSAKVKPGPEGTKRAKKPAAEKVKPTEKRAEKTRPAEAPAKGVKPIILEEKPVREAREPAAPPKPRKAGAPGMKRVGFVIFGTAGAIISVLLIAVGVIVINPFGWGDGPEKKPEREIEEAGLPSEKGTETSVEVPDLINKSVFEAESELRLRDFEVGSADSDGFVTSQSPAAGTELYARKGYWKFSLLKEAYEESVFGGYKEVEDSEGPFGTTYKKEPVYKTVYREAEYELVWVESQ
jgi:hypothetical protein